MEEFWKSLENLRILLFKAPELSPWWRWCDCPVRTGWAEELTGSSWFVSPWDVLMAAVQKYDLLSCSLL